jgi:hypothetical protein
MKQRYMAITRGSASWLFLRWLAQWPPWRTMAAAAGCLLYTLLPAQPAAGSDPESFIHIDSVTLEGNRKTRPAYVFRELEFAAGDSIRLADLPELLERNRLRLINTRLFSRVDLGVRHWSAGQHVVIHIQVVEGWYIYPMPVFSLADRNFNVWWHEYDRSLRRVNYGLNWFHRNVTGRADVLKAGVQFGYSNEYDVRYTSPAINRRQTLGFEVGMSYSRRREVAYMTHNNKQLFRVNPDIWQLERRQATAGVTWRPGLYTLHNFVAEYHDNRIADSIATEFNPEFFGHSRNRQRHLSLAYILTRDRRDIQAYPLNGWLAALELRQNGILPSDNFQMFRAQAEYNHYHSFGPRVGMANSVRGRISLPRSRPPYFNNQALGYGQNSVRGFQYYVIDGLDFGIYKNTFRFRLLDHTFDFSRFIPMKAYKVVPLQVYLTLNNDLGYSNDPFYGEGNPLSNRLLWGYGLGLDFIVFNDKVARFEWNWNDLGTGGFYLNINTGL